MVEVVCMGGSIQPGRLASVPTNQQDYCFSSGRFKLQRVTKRQLTDTVFHGTVATSV